MCRAHESVTVDGFSDNLPKMFDTLRSDIDLCSRSGLYLGLKGHMTVYSLTQYIGGGHKKYVGSPKDNSSQSCYVFN